MKWFEDISELDERFIKSYNEKTDEGYLLKFNVQGLENVHILHNYLPFLPQRIKFEKN